VVAFSGGPDSTALLVAMAEVAPREGMQVVAAHVDHGMDAGSGARAAEAETIARRTGVEFRLLSCTGRGQAPPLHSEGSPEARARHLRYTALEELRATLGARFVLTAHHADDQAETALLRMLHGSGIAGLAAMERVHATILRPLLRFRRDELAAVVAAAGITPVTDPTNRDLRVPRNRLRHALLPALGGDASARALGVAAAASALRGGLERRLLRLLPELDTLDPALPVARLRELPAEVLPWALALLHRRSGLPYPPRARTTEELRRRIRREAPRDGSAIDAGAGARWQVHGGLLRVRATGWQRPDAPTSFSYTVAVPGGVEIREAGTTFRLTPQPVAPWMWRGSADRAALDLPLAASGSVTVRSRRPGDRLQPLGCPHRRLLKDLLIDRKVPRDRRARLPLLCLGEQIAWVPGVTIHAPFRLREGASTAWVAELQPETC